MRTATNKLLDLIDEGLLTDKQVLEELLHWLSEDEIRDFLENSPFFDDLKEIEE